MKKLPLDPVALIRLAANDIEKTMTQENVRINMNTWIRHGRQYLGEDVDIVYVCLAGAVMLNTLGVASYSAVNSHRHSTLINALDDLCRFDFYPFFKNVSKARGIAYGYKRDDPAPKELISLLEKKYGPDQGWTGLVDDEEVPTLVAQLRDIANMIEEAMTNEKSAT